MKREYYPTQNCFATQKKCLSIAGENVKYCKSFDHNTCVKEQQAWKQASNELIMLKDVKRDDVQLDSLTNITRSGLPSPRFLLSEAVDELPNQFTLWKFLT